MQKVVIETLDDIDGTQAAETVVFGLDGTTYEVDVSEKNASKMRKALEPYVAAGRKITRNDRRRRRSAPTGPAAADVRVWAASHGLDCPDRGRVPAEVRDAYIAANGS